MRMKRPGHARASPPVRMWPPIQAYRNIAFTELQLVASSPTAQLEM